MPGYTKTVEPAKVPPDTMVKVVVEGEPVVIAHVNGTYLGMGALCAHQKWDLSEGTLKGTELTCGGHGTVWDLNTGKGKFEEPLPEEPLYDVKEEGGFLYVRKR